MKLVIKKIVFTLQVLLVSAALVFGLEGVDLLIFSTQAQGCPVGEIVSDTVVLTPTSVDNVIDCSAQDITVVDGGELIIESYKVSDSSAENDGGAVLLVQNLTVESGGKVSANGKGYIAGEVDSVGTPVASAGYTGGSGGGHGGAGGYGLEDGANDAPTPGISYGNVNAPVLLGGGGGNSGDGGNGGAGGGAIKIESTGTVRVDGVISANGEDGLKGDISSGGGGAGGSIWIEAEILAGIGSVEAKGGSSDPSVTYPGGGGGGGRIVMFSQGVNNFSGTTSVDPGSTSLSQDGGTGSLIGPTSIPAVPTVLKQFASDGATEIGVGGVTNNTTVIFASNLIDSDSENTLLLQIELRPVGEAFTNTATHTQSTASSNPQSCTSGTSIDCGKITVNDLARNTSYHWQARVRDNKGGISDWISYGDNSEDSTDFTVSGSAATISLEGGNEQSATVGAELLSPFTVQVVDGEGLPVQGQVVSWQIVNSSGGGILLDGTKTTTNADGYASNRYQLGTTSGTNTIRAVVTGLTGSPVTFTATGTAGSIHHFDVITPQYAITNESFDTVTIIARDQYGNRVSDYTGTPSLAAVSLSPPYDPLSGVLNPTSVEFASQDTVTLSNMTYDTAESIKLQVQAGDAVGRSESIAIVESLGTCPDVDGIIDTNQTWSADSSNKGIFDCSGLDIHITNNAVLSLASYDSGDTNYTNDYGTTILAASITVDLGSKITADALGYGPLRGPGAGSNWYCGAVAPSHGGYGHGSSGNGAVYGSVYEPVTMGSGTGTQYGSTSGGGAIKLVVSGTTTVNGTITANGGNTVADCNTGGSGGSIWIDTNILNGSDTMLISAKGETGNVKAQGSAGGGRIALYYNSSNIDIPSYVSTGKIHTTGSSALGYSSGAGTVYVEQKGVDPVRGGHLLVDNNNINSSKSAALLEDNYLFESIKLTRYGDLTVVGSSSVLMLTSSTGVLGDATFPSLTSEGTISYTGSGALEINGVDIGIKGDITGVSDIEIGVDQVAGMTLYANTWAHDKDNPYSFGNITVGSNATVTLPSYDSGDTDYSNDFGVTLQADNLTVESGGVITADALGYGPLRGPGAGSNGHCWAIAPSHGGYGHGSSGNAAVYGSVYEPVTMGSGTGTQHGSASGGGAIKLVVSGTTTVNGTITANGGYTAGGCNTGGSGGSIWIDTNVLNGSDTTLITAKGERGNSSEGAQGAAGGGRIALYYNSSNIDFPTYVSTGKIHTTGSSVSGFASGAGTVYVEQKGVDPVRGGHLLVDNNNINGNKSAALLEDNYLFESIKLTRYGNLTVVGSSSNLVLTSSTGVLGDVTLPSLITEGTISYTGSGALEVNGIDLGVKGDITGVSDIEIGGSQIAGLTLYANTWAHNKDNQYSFGNIVVRSNSTMSLVSYDSGDTDYTNDFGVTLQADNLTVESGGKITADGLGYGPLRGPSAGSNSYCTSVAPSHAGYGDGKGGRGPLYGDIYEPVTMGSGTGTQYGGTSGGGAIKLVVSGTTTVNGTITANGGNTSGDCNSGGSGGSIWIDTNVLNGSDTMLISAKGEKGNLKATGSAGGGRIALYYNSSNIDIPTYVLNGKINTYGSSISSAESGGTRVSGSGTVYIEDREVYEEHKGDLYIDNNGLSSQITDFEAKEYLFNNLYIGPNLYAKVKGNTENNSGTVLNLTGDFTLESGSVIDGVGEGFSAADGPGAGNTGTILTGGGGGGHGGSGGNGVSGDGNLAGGGVFYGSQRQPLTLGSGGGNSESGAVGGNGGGAFAVLAKQGQVNILGEINVSGTDGAPAESGGGGGGGAGGSLFVYTNSCNISGTLYANGGDGGSGDFSGGGGGGGRVSILYIQGPCDFSGAVSVQSGSSEGGQEGQVGTFPSEPNSVPFPTDFQNQYEIKGSMGSGDAHVLGVNTSEELLGTGDAGEVVEVPIPLGGTVQGNTITFRSSVFDAGASSLTPKTLKIEVELKKVGEDFDGTTNIHSSDSILFSGGDPVVLAVKVEDLELGTSYKWRVRAVNVNNLLASDWRDFGNNGDEADFTISQIKALTLESSKTEVELGEKFDLRVSIYDMFDSITDQYSGTVQFTTNTDDGYLTPSSITFEADISAIMDISQAAYFTKPGTYLIIAYDDENNLLYDSIEITVLPAKVPTLELLADRENIVAGETVTLAWVSEHVTSLVLSYDGEEINVNDKSSIDVKPTRTTTYTLSGTGANGEDMSSSVEITVLPSSDGSDSELESENEPKNPENVEQGGEPVDEGDNIPPIIEIPRVAVSSFLDRIQNKEVVSAVSVASLAIVYTTYSMLTTPVYFKQLLTFLLPFVRVRKKKRGYILIYDSITREPINGAVVRVINSENKLIETGVSDIFGTLDLPLREGSYKLKIMARGYSYPSTIITKYDSPLENIYHGEEFTAKDGKPIEFSIPLDPENNPTAKSLLRTIGSKLSILLRIIIYILIVVSFVLLIASLTEGITAIKIVTLCAYIIFVILNIIAIIKGNKLYGVVRDSQGNALEGVEIGIRDLEFEQLTAKRVTDKEGRYRFVIPSGRYKIEILNQDLELGSGQQTMFQEKEGRIMIINPTLTVKRR